MEHGQSWAASLASRHLEMRRDMDGDEMQISRPGWRWDTIWMEEGCNYKKLNGGEPGHGWRWDTHPETSMGLRWDLAGIEMQQDGVEERLGWIWNANHETWMEVRRDLDGVQALISKRGFVWDSTWMELWCKYHDLNGGDVTWIQMRHETSDLDGGETVHRWGEIRILKFGCRWNKTCITRINPVSLIYLDGD